MGRPTDILKKLRSQTKVNSDLEKHEVVVEAKQEDIGQIIVLGGDTAPIRIHLYRKGYRDAFDPDLFKLKRVGLKRTEVNATQPNAFRTIYTHEVIDRKTSRVVGEVLTRLFRAPGAGPSWDLLLIKIHGVEVYRLKGA